MKVKLHIKFKIEIDFKNILIKIDFKNILIKIDFKNIVL